MPNEDILLAAVEFGEKCKKLSEALCVIRGYEVHRAYTDQELAAEFAEVAVALVSARALQSGRTQD